MIGACQNGCGDPASDASPIPNFCVACGEYEKGMRERAASFATRNHRVPCPGCVSRGVKNPNKVKRGLQCNACADLEESAT